jgi:hypothetical protein
MIGDPRFFGTQVIARKSTSFTVKVRIPKTQYGIAHKLIKRTMVFTFLTIGKSRIG